VKNFQKVYYFIFVTYIKDKKLLYSIIFVTTVGMMADLKQCKSL